MASSASVMWVLLACIVCCNSVLQYQPSRGCTGGPRPGLTALKNVLTRRFPFTRSGGIYNCRNARGGSNLSEHAEGRAYDAMVRVGDPRAQVLADLIVKHADALGVQSVIYNRRVWGYGRWNSGWRPYTGVAPHTDHVHIGMNLAAASSMTEARIDAILSGSSIPSGGYSPSAPSSYSPPSSPSTYSRPSQSRPRYQPQSFMSQPSTDGSSESAPAAPPSPGKCVMARHNAYVRSSVAANARVNLIAQEGEKFTYSRTSHGWYRVSNSRGSGWSYGRFWTPCKCIQARTRVHVRAGPGTRYKVITLASPGDQYTQTKTVKGWYKVSGPGGSGYSYARYWTGCASDFQMPQQQEDSNAQDPEDPGCAGGVCSIRRT